jgi:hypothetical protein
VAAARRQLGCRQGWEPHPAAHTHHVGEPQWRTVSVAVGNTDGDDESRSVGEHIADGGSQFSSV